MVVTATPGLVASPCICIDIAVVVGVLLAFVIARGIVSALTRIIAGLNEGADQVNDAAGQVSAASQQLAEGNSEQASSLEETSSALEQMAAMTRTNAGNAKAAEELSAQAQTVKGMVNELVTMVGGKSAQAGPPTTSMAAAPKAVKKRLNVNVAHLNKDKQTDAKPVVAGTASDKSSNDFMSMDDGSDLKDF